MLLQELADLRVDPEPLQLVECPVPEPGRGEVRLRISTCGVCHTELDEIEGRTAPPRLPVILGHQAVGRIDKLGSQVAGRQLGERVGVAWIYAACGQCKWCLTQRENLCPNFGMEPFQFVDLISRESQLVGPVNEEHVRHPLLHHCHLAHHRRHGARSWIGHAGHLGHSLGSCCRSGLLSTRMVGLMFSCRQACDDGAPDEEADQDCGSQYSFHDALLFVENGLTSSFALITR